MNVYDFDNTILRGDSSALFFGWCLLRTPRMWLDIPAQAVNGLLFLLKIKPKQAFKQRMFGYLKFIDTDKAVAAFWKDMLNRVKPWYRQAHRPDDVVISASPEFLIAPICRRLGIRTAMGSPVDPKTGRFHGKNCHGEEKVRRFYARFPRGKIDTFYSDSHSDDPLARLAQKSVLVRGERLLDWEAKR